MKLFDRATQFLLPILTISSMMLTSFKYPQYGVIVALISQPFWLYSSWVSYKKGGQIGMFVTTSILTVITVWGVINYWFLS
jgi:hypothetical protein